MKSADEMSRVAVIGAGVMGEGIAQSFAEAGFEVSLVDVSNTALERCISQISANLQTSVDYGIVTESPDVVCTRITTIAADELDSVLPYCDLVIEAAPEVLELKRGLFTRLDSARSETLLATNTSSFTVSQLTEGMQSSRRVVGLHFFNPAHLIPAVEVHGGHDTDPEALAIAMQLMKRIGKIPVIVRKESPGFVINRLTGALSREIDHMLDEGIVAPEDLDGAIKASLGFRLAQIGPMEAKDLIGLDTDVRVSRNVYPTLSNRTEPSQWLVDKVEQGDLGVKTGKGCYSYDGRSREEVLGERNRRLLEQRRLFDSQTRR